MKMRFGSNWAVAALLVVACGDDASPDEPTDDSEETAPEEKADASAKDAGRTKKDASVPARDSGGDTTDPPSDLTDAATDEPTDAKDASTGAPVDAGSTDAGRRDAGVVDAGKTDAGKSDAGGGSTCDTLTYESFGKSFMTSYCTSCHGSLLAQKNIHLDTLAGVTAAKNKVKSEVSSKSMPPGGSKAPSAAERTQLGQWIDCGPK